MAKSKSSFQFVLVTSSLLLLGVVCFAGFLLLTAPAYHTSLVTVGTAEQEMHSGGKLVLVGNGRGLTDSYQFPMWVLNYEGTTLPMWGYVKVKRLSQADQLLKDTGKRLVSLGNFADRDYISGTLPIYDGKNWFDPVKRIYLDTTTKAPPEEFLIVLWLDDDAKNKTAEAK